MGKEFNRLSITERAAGFALALAYEDEVATEFQLEQAFRNGHKSAARAEAASNLSTLPVPVKQTSRLDSHGAYHWLHSAVTGLLPRRIAL